MALVETAKLLAALELKDQFTPTLKNANTALGKFDSKLDHTQSRAYVAGQQIGTGIKRGAALAAVGIGLVASQVALGLRSLIELEQQTAQTEAVIKSTGGVAGITAKNVGVLAEKYEALNAIVGDEVIRNAENLLLTFTNVRVKAFEPALKAALDMNTAMGKGPEGLTTTIIQVGKALNDPTQGFSALRRVGVSFSVEQVKRIKSLQKEGKLYEAQQIILAELNKEFGGSFLAQGNTTAGKVAKFNDAIEDLQRTLAVALLPTVSNVADAMTKLLTNPATQKGAEELGKSIAKFLSPENIATAASAVSSVLTILKGSAPLLEQVAGGMAGVIKTAVAAFRTLPPEIQKLAIAGFAVNKLTGGLLTNIAGGIFGALKAMTVQAGVVNVSGPVAGGGLPGAAGAGASSLPSLVSLIPIAGIVAAVSAAFTEHANTTAHNAGLTSTVDNPFAGGIFGGLTVLPSMLGVMQELLNVAKNPPKPPAPTGTEHRQGKAADDLVPATKKGTQQAIKDAARNAALVAKVQASVDRDRADTTSRLDRVKATAASVRDRVESGTIRNVSATDRGAGNIVAAIHGIPAPIVNVRVSGSEVTKSQTNQNRNGGGGSSRNKDRATPV